MEDDQHSLSFRLQAETGEKKTAFELAFVAATTSTAVALLLQPLQGRNRDEASSSSASSRAPASDKARIERQAEHIKKLEASLASKRKAPDQPGQRGRGRGRGRGAGNGRGRGRGGGDDVMNITQAMATMTLKLPPGNTSGPPGDAICFNFNVGKCTRGVPGQRCATGWHVCCKPGCQQVHAMIAHR